MKYSACPNNREGPAGMSWLLNHKNFNTLIRIRMGVNSGQFSTPGVFGLLPYLNPKNEKNRTSKMTPYFTPYKSVKIFMI